MKKSFYSIGKSVEVELVIKRSRFIAAASPVDDEDEANSFIEQIREGGCGYFPVLEGVTSGQVELKEGKCRYI